LAEEDFTSIVKEVWLDLGFLVETDFQHIFVWKLKVLKTRIKTRARLLWHAKFLRLETLEEELRVAYMELQRDGKGSTIDFHLKYLEEEQNAILLQDEELWRQRSREIWMKCGD
jgi:hypothetical protein